MKNINVKNKLGIRFVSVATVMTLLAGSICACGKTDAQEVEESVNDTEEIQAVMEQQAGIASSASSVDKEEVVYIIADANGNTNRVIVSDWLKNSNGDNKIFDTTNLTDIENVSGDENYSLDEDGNIIWDAAGNDIHYQGTTDAALPVDVAITYFLDGKEIAPEDLAGQSGEVKIRFDYTNNETVKATIDGNETDIYVPFTMMSGAMLDGDHFSNIEVTNGRVITTGGNVIVVGMAFPGLYDSLDIDGLKDKLDKDTDSSKLDEVAIPDYVEITATAKDFKMNQTMTMAFSDVLSSLQLDSDIQLGLDSANISDSVNELSDGANQLADGSQELNDGSAKLRDGAKTLSEKSVELDDGAKKLNDGAGDLLAGANQLNEGASELANGIGQVDEGVAQLVNGAGELDAGAGALKDGADRLAAGTASLANQVPALDAGAGALLEGSNQLGAGLGQLQDGVNTLDAYMGQISAGLSQSASSVDVNAIDAGIAQVESYITAYSSKAADCMNNGDMDGYADYATMVGILQSYKSTLEASKSSAASIQSLSENVGAISSSVHSLATESVPALVNGNASITAGLGDLKAGTAAVVDGANKLNDGAGSLANGAGSLRDGTSKLSSGVGTLKDGTSQLVNGANTLTNGTGELAAGAKTLKDGTNELQDGTEQFVDGTAQLYDGTISLNDGTKDLMEGMFQFKEEGVDKLTDLFGENVTSVIDRLQAIMDAGHDYSIFSDSQSDASSSVKFIYKTEPVK